MSGSKLGFVTFALLAGAVSATGCSEVRGRRLIQEANQLYKDGNYKEAVATFEQAEKLLPDFWVLWLNKGYTCRQMLVPGAKTPENQAAADCALSSFKRMQELKPADARGELLYIQTLFDADQYETLAKMYEGRIQKNPQDIDAVTGLIQVYTKWNKVEEALEWFLKKAQIQANDAEAQYAVGVFIWQQLSSKGGGPEMAGFDPRPDPNNPKAPKKVPPQTSPDALVSQQRVDMADTGIKYLERALALRPKYHEAMTYMNLLYRQKSFAFFSDPADWQKSVDKAEEWRKKSLETQGKPVTPALGAPKTSEKTADQTEGADDATEPGAATAAVAAAEPAKAAGKAAAKGKAAKAAKKKAKKPARGKKRAGRK